MADALCGPSNAIQSFKNHASKDRTLQQDRLVSAQGQSSSGFRTPSQNAGALDPEFEAFQAGGPIHSPAPPLPNSNFFQQQQHIPQNHAPLSHQSPASAIPDWAVEFQNLKLQSPSPIELQQSRNSPAVPSQTSMNNKTSTFNPMYQPSFGYTNSGYGSSMGMGAGMGMGMGMGMSMNMGPGLGTSYMNQQSQPQFQTQPQMQQQNFGFDDAAFEKAFDAASAEIAKESLAKDQMMSGAMDSKVSKEAKVENPVLDKQINENIVFPAPSVQEQVLNESQEEEEQKNQPDSLAETAGQLLDNISHDTSEKFAQSNFLALMRRLRDKEVVVEGENFIDSSSKTIANTTGVASEQIEEPESLLNQNNLDIQDSKDSVVFVPPPRPITPEIDPPAPSFEQWKQRLMEVFEP